jgi:hypothetical protein
MSASLTDRLRTAATICFPKSPSSGIARLLDVNLRRAQYWMTGKELPPEQIVELLEAAAALTLKVGPGPALEALVAEWRQAGLPEPIIAAALMAAATPD